MGSTILSATKPAWMVVRLQPLSAIKVLRGWFGAIVTEALGNFIGVDLFTGGFRLFCGPRRLM